MQNGVRRRAVSWSTRSSKDITLLATMPLRAAKTASFVGERGVRAERTERSTIQIAPKVPRNATMRAWATAWFMRSAPRYAFVPRSLLLCAGLGAACLALRAQWTPAALAVKLPDSLVFDTTAVIASTSVVWHPVNQRYYSARIGNATFPLHTWLPTGGLSIARSTTGIDTRGMWYNPSTGQVERNCFATLGWATMDIDGTLNATNTFTTIFTGQLQPTAQSCGAFDPVSNEVLFYNAGSVQIRSRATGAVTQTLALTGATLTNVNTNIVYFTGQAGYEIGLLDYVAKRVLLFNRATGAFSGMSQLPATAVTSAGFQSSYTNGRLWLFTSATKKWNAYCIWAEQCSLLLPVELIDWKARCSDDGAELTWVTATERNSSHFTVERSTDGEDWETVGTVPAEGHSQQRTTYRLLDTAPHRAPFVRYRLRQVDLDGTDALSDQIHLEGCDRKLNGLRLHPNPTSDRCMVFTGTEPTGARPLQLMIVDAQGRTVRSLFVQENAVASAIQVDLSALTAGSYAVLMIDNNGVLVDHATMVKQ